MADWVLNFKGNLGSKSAEDAAQIGKLTAAMVAEEAQLKRLEIARLRAAAGDDAKGLLKANAGIDAAKKKIAALAAELSNAPKVGDAISKADQKAGEARVKAWKEAGIKAGRAFVAGLAIVTTATLATAAGLGVFGAKAADAERSTRLLNEAADLAGGGGHKLNAVIKQIADETPLAKEKIGELARELSIARLDGRQTQLTLSAASVASSALGDAAGGAVVQIAKQSREIRRFTLGARDLYGQYSGLAGTGLKTADVIGALAKQLKTSAPAAEAAMRAGRVTVEQGLAAIDAATKAKFGGVVSRQMLSLDVQTRKLGEHLSDLFSGVNADPALKGLHDVLGVFDSTTYAGDTLKSLLAAVFNDLSGGAEKAAPKIKSFFMGLEAGALQFYIAIKPALKALGATDTKGADGISASFKAGEAAAKAFGAVLADILSTMQKIGDVASAIAHPIDSFVKAASYEGDKGLKYETIDDGYKGKGMAITAGIAAGIRQGSDEPKGAIRSLSDALKAEFSGPKGIDAHSPSKAFERRAEMIPAGTVRGIEKGTPDVEAAVIGMASVRGGGNTTNNTRTTGPVTININGNGDAALARIIDSRVYGILKAIADAGSVQ